MYSVCYADVKNDIKKVQTDLGEIEDDVLGLDFVMEKLAGLENRSRRNDVQINGIQETSNQIWESCEEEVIKIIKTN